MANSKGVVTVLPPKIHRATLRGAGGTTKLEVITEAQAIAERKAGRDVVVCGTDLNANRKLAEHIETTANGECRFCPRQFSGGPDTLPHCQPMVRGPDGHTFFETVKQKAFKPKIGKKKTWGSS